jgi:hypothetical protein
MIKRSFHFAVRLIRNYPVLAAVIAFPYAIVIGGVMGLMALLGSGAPTDTKSETEQLTQLRSAAVACLANGAHRFEEPCLTRVKQYEVFVDKLSIRSRLEMEERERILLDLRPASREAPPASQNLNAKQSMPDMPFGRKGEGE